MLFKLYDPDDPHDSAKTSRFLPSEYEQSHARTLGDLVDLFGDYIALREQAHGRFELALGFFGGDGQSLPDPPSEFIPDPPTEIQQVQSPSAGEERPVDPFAESPFDSYLKRQRLEEKRHSRNVLVVWGGTFVGGLGLGFAFDALFGASAGAYGALIGLFLGFFAAVWLSDFW